MKLRFIGNSHNVEIPLTWECPVCSHGEATLTALDVAKGMLCESEMTYTCTCGHVFTETF